MSKIDRKYFTVKFELVLEPWQKDLIDKKMLLMKRIYNALNHKIRCIYHNMTLSNAYKEAVANDDKFKSKRKKFIKEYRHEFRNNKGEILKYKHKIKKENGEEEIVMEIPTFFSKFVFNSYAAKFLPTYSKCGINNKDLELIADNLWKAWEKFIDGSGKKIKRCDDFNFYRSRIVQNTFTGFDAYYVKSDYKIGIKIKNRLFYAPFKFDNDSIYQIHAMSLPIRTIGVQRIEIRGKIRYYVVFGFEGVPYNKGRKLGKGRVGIDLGPSNIAVVSEDNVMLGEIAAGIDTKQQRLKYLMRKLDRLRRVNNPWMFNEDGTIKKIEKKKRPKLVESLQYKKVKREIHNISRVIKAQRKILHNILANSLLSYGDFFIVENNNFKAMQRKTKEDKINDKGKHISKKRFGKSIANHAPSALMEILANKIKALDGSFYKVDTSIAATQFDFTDGSFTKHKLKEKCITLSDGKTHQRDIIEAFNLMHIRVLDKKKYDKSADNYNVEGQKEKYTRFSQLEERELKRLESMYNGIPRKFWS